MGGGKRGGACSKRGKLTPAAAEDTLQKTLPVRVSKAVLSTTGSRFGEEEEDKGDDDDDDDDTSFAPRSLRADGSIATEDAAIAADEGGLAASHHRVRVNTRTKDELMGVAGTRELERTPRSPSHTSTASKEGSR